MTVDLRSVAGKKFDITGHTPLLVVGAGPAGLAAAIEAAKAGIGVTLVEENPVAFETMGESVPLFFGNRMSGAVRNRNAMMEAMLESSPDIATAFELGVDVRLGTACWGLFTNAKNLNWLESPIAGLSSDADGTRLISFDNAIVATGRRDMGIAFPGWDQPGVLGATAAVTLARKYKALDGSRAVVVGSTADAALTAVELLNAGVEVLCLVEQNASPVAPSQYLSHLAERGVPVKCDNVVKSVKAGANGVCGVELVDGYVDCDLVVLAVGAVPMIDLLASVGAKVEYDGNRGGFVPVLDAMMTTSFPHIKAVGDCAGIWSDKSAYDSIAASEGRNAALSILDGQTPFWSPPHDAEYDLSSYRKDWVRKSVVEAEEEPYVCQCEEVMAREILEVQPPRYLEWQLKRNAQCSLSEILETPPSADQIKRLTRAGMGPCQGRRCREQIQALLALQEDIPLHDVPLSGYRAPVRPMTLKAATPINEDPAIGAQWDSWFGMPRQWLLFHDVEEKYTVAVLQTEKEHVSE